VKPKIYLLFHGVSGKVHIEAYGIGARLHSETLCGDMVVKQYDKMAFAPVWKPSKHPDWCSKCITKMVTRLIKSKGTGLLRPLMDYVLNMPIKEKEKKEETIDSFRAELTFDDEEMEIKVLAGKSTGARGNFVRESDMKLTLSWDQLDSIRDLTEDTEEVKMTIFSCKADEV